MDAVLDLGQDCRGAACDGTTTRERGTGKSNADPERRLAVREASTELLVELDPDSNVTDLLLGQHAKDPAHAAVLPQGPQRLG